MTVTVLYPEAMPAGGMVRCRDAVYEDARTGMGTLTAYTPGTEGQIGQFYSVASDYNAYQSFLGFDLSDLPAGESVLSADLHVLFPDWHTKPIADAFTVEVRACDFGAGVAIYDFIDGDELSLYELVASYPSGDITFDAFNVVALNAAGIAWLDAGNGRFLLASDRQRTAATPTASEYVSMRARGYEEENTAGEWAYLTVTTASGATLLINGGDTTTFDDDVTLTLDSGEAVANSFRLSNDGGATWSARYPYATSKAWKLAAGTSGTRTVTVEYSTEYAGD